MFLPEESPLSRRLLLFRGAQWPHLWVVNRQDPNPTGQQTAQVGGLDARPQVPGKQASHRHRTAAALLARGLGGTAVIVLQGC